MNNMKYDKKLIDKLGNELFELWNECSIRCEKIKNVIDQINKEK